MIKIIPPKGPNNLGVGTVVFDDKGSAIGGVRDIKVIIKPDNLMIAEVTMIASLEDVWAHPFMSESSFLDAAKRYGYEVKKV